MCSAQVDAFKIKFPHLCADDPLKNANAENATLMNDAREPIVTRI